MVHRVLVEEAVIANATMTHIVTEETLTLEELLQAKTSHSECQAAGRTIEFLSSLVIYNHDGILVLQAALEEH